MTYTKLIKAGSLEHWTAWHDCVFSDLEQHYAAHNEGEEGSDECDVAIFHAVSSPWHGKGAVLTEVSRATETITLVLTRTAYIQDHPERDDAARMLYVDGRVTRTEIQHT